METIVHNGAVETRFCVIIAISSSDGPVRPSRSLRRTFAEHRHRVVSGERRPTRVRQIQRTNGTAKVDEILFHRVRRNRLHTTSHKTMRFRNNDCPGRTYNNTIYNDRLARAPVGVGSVVLSSFKRVYSRRRTVSLRITRPGNVVQRRSGRRQFSAPFAKCFATESFSKLTRGFEKKNPPQSLELTAFERKKKNAKYKITFTSKAHAGRLRIS